MFQTTLALFYFFYFGVVGIYVIFMPKVLSMVGYSASEIGLIFSAAPLVRFILPFILSRGIAITKERFNFALVLMFVSALSFFLTLENFYALFLSNIAMGVAMSLILPYIEVLALQRVAKESYGKIRLFGSIGFIIIALVVVRFLDGAEIALSYLSSFALLSTLLAYFLSKDSHATKKEQNSLINDINLLKDYKLWLSLALMQVSFGAFYNFFTLYETSYGVSLDMTINLWVFGVLVEIVMLYVQGRFLKYNLITLLEITLGATVVRWALLYLFPTNLAILFFSQSLHALSFALFYSASIMYLHQIYTNKVLAQQFFSGITFGLGGLVGAVMFGYIYELNKELTFLVASFVAFVALGFMVMWKRERG